MNPLKKRAWWLYIVGARIEQGCANVAAFGEGRRDAMAGVLGMFFGAAAYVAIYFASITLIKAMADFGKVTLPQFTGTSLWLWVAGLAIAIAIAAALALLDRKLPKELHSPP